MAGDAEQIAALQRRNSELEVENAALRARVAELTEIVVALKGKIADLEKVLGRNSSNSGKPPSTDSGTAKSKRPENANRAARRAMGRSQGKQPGTPGAMLCQVPDPDAVQVHRPTRCRSCHADLADAEVVGTAARQVFDVPVPKRVVTEHRAERRRCGCGCETTAVFPAEATGPACYGPSIKAHALYLMCAQHLPRERCAQALADLFAVPVSTGTLDNWMREAAEALAVFLTVVAAQLQEAPVIHADETSVRSEKAALWFHVWCTPLLTLLGVGQRNKDTIDTGPLKDYTGTVMHDRLAMYFSYGTAHVLCNAHIVRSLNELLANHRHRDWAKAFIELIIDTKDKADTARTAGKPSLSASQRYRIRRRWNTLCTQAARAAPPAVAGTKLYGTNKDAHNLAVALAEHRDLFLAYTADLSLPWDNNLAERSLRMVKVQAKISGEFRSHTGAKRFAAVRSYIATTRQHDKNIHEHLKRLYTPTGAWLRLVTRSDRVTGYPKTDNTPTRTAFEMVRYRLLLAKPATENRTSRGRFIDEFPVIVPTTYGYKDERREKNQQVARPEAKEQEACPARGYQNEGNRSSDRGNQRMATLDAKQPSSHFKPLSDMTVIGVSALRSIWSGVAVPPMVEHTRRNHDRYFPVAT